jgi:hypothetical protein
VIPLRRIEVPTRAIIDLEWELADLVFGTATLTLHVLNGKLARFTTGHEQSRMVEADDE